MDPAFSKVCIRSLGGIFHFFATFSNEDKFVTLYLFSFMVGCIIVAKYFGVSHGGDPIVDTTALMR